MTQYLIKSERGVVVGQFDATSEDEALDMFYDQFDGDNGASGYSVEPKPYEGPWCVCLYLVDRAYGGPEEGGWWYGCGTPVIEKGLPLPSWHELEGDADSALVAMEKQCTELNKGRRDIGSVLSEGIYRAIMCEGVPKPFPENKPHYE